ncbi:hypothetical protein TYRP_021121, partial [Tyrophagus putrescentiae]
HWFEYNSWIEQSKGNWPSADHNSTAPFLVLHSEYAAGPILKLKKEVFNASGNWITNPDLSFKYWASEQAFFRSRVHNVLKPRKNLRLFPEEWRLTDNQESSSAATSLKAISQEEWNGFQFEDFDVLTLALKDVSVKYIEKIDAHKEDSITAYPINATGFKVVNFHLAHSNTGDIHSNERNFTIDPKSVVSSKFSHVKGFIQMEGIQVVNFPATLRDICYIISKNDSAIVETAASSVDVYLTLEGAKRIALQGIDKYMITLVVQGEVTADFSLQIKYQRLIHDEREFKSLESPNGELNNPYQTTAQSFEAFNKAFIKDNERTLTSASVLSAKMNFSAVNNYFLTFNNKSETTFTFSLDAIDMRFQKLQMAIDLVNADGSTLYIPKNKHSKSFLLLKSVVVKKSSEAAEFDLFSHFNGSNNIVFYNFNISSDEVLFIKPTQTQFSGNKITIKLNLNVAPQDKPAPVVKLRFFVQSNEVLELKTTKLTIQNLNLLQSTSGETIEIKLERIQIFRVIIDQGYPKIASVSGKLDVTKKIAIFSDFVTPEESKTVINGPFRVLYVIHANFISPENHVKVTTFEVQGAESNNTHIKNFKHFLAHSNPRYDRQKGVCAYENALNNEGTCQLPHFNRAAEMTCDMAAGCGNLFDRVLPVSSRPVVPLSPDHHRFVPYQAASNVPGKVGTHPAANLKVLRPPLVAVNQSTSPQTDDFCLDFHYLARETPLQVSVANGSSLVFPLTPKTETEEAKTPPGRHAKVCASYLTEEPVSKVKELVFSFDHDHQTAQKVLDIDGHFVEIVWK